jgi:hypothetical protein
MKGSSSTDGKMHGNVQMIDRYNESKNKKPARPKERGGESGGEHEPSGHDEIKQVVAEHGPAHKLVIEHDHAGGEHHVTSHHEDGYVHRETLGTPEMAHAHAAHAGGVSDSSALQEAHGGMQEEDTMHEAGHRSRIERSSHRSQAGEGFLPEHGVGAEG